MKPTKVLQEIRIRKMRFEEAYEGWNAGRLTQAEAARILGVCELSFRRYMGRYEEEGLDGLIDRRLEQASNRQAPVYEAMALTDEYRRRYTGWNVKHFHCLYKRTGGTRSYTWVKRRLQEARLVPKSKKRGAHRKRRERSALPGMMIHQDGSTTRMGRCGRILRTVRSELTSTNGPSASGGIWIPVSLKPSSKRV